MRRRKISRISQLITLFAFPTVIMLPVDNQIQEVIILVNVPIIFLTNENNHKMMREKNY